MGLQTNIGGHNGPVDKQCNKQCVSMTLSYV